MSVNNRITFRKLFSPYFLDEFSIFKKIRQNAVQFKGKLLDIWCRNKPYEKLFKNVEKYIGLDIVKWDKVDIIWDANKKLIFKDEEFDVIFSSQVITDIYNVDNFFQESYRILKEWWYLFITTEFICPVNDIPYDYYRFTFYFLERKLKEVWFKIEKLESTSTDIFSIWLLKSVYLWRMYLKLKEKTNFFKFLFPIIIFIIFVNNTFYLFLSKILPKTYNFPLWYILIAKK